MPAGSGPGWWSRLIRRVRGYTVARRIALGLAIAFAVGGGLVAVLAPGGLPLVPRSPAATGDAPTLRYVRQFPDEEAAPLVRPTGVAVGGGHVYVADSGGGVVRVFSTEGAEDGEMGRGLLKVPTYVARDAATGAVLVSDRELGALLRFADVGASPKEVRPSTEPTAPWEPFGVDADAKGRIAVTDASSRSRLIVMDDEGTVSLEIGGAVATGGTGSVAVALDFPNGVILADQQLWVSDSNNRRVLVFSANGVLERLIRIEGIGRGLAYIPGREGAVPLVAVADVLGSMIILLDREGTEVARFGGPGATAGRLAYPNDVAFDADSGLLYVADTGNARVQVWEVVAAGGKGGAGRPSAPVGATPRFSAMRIAGVVGAVLGLAVVVATVWPRRER